MADSSRSPSPPGEPRANGDAVAGEPRPDSSGKNRSRSRSRERSRSGRPLTRSKSGSPDSRAQTRSRTGTPQSRSRSRDRKRSRDRRRSRSGSRRRRSRSRERRSPRGRRSRSHSRSPTPDDEGRLHVADLDANASKRDLEKVFGKFGPLKEIWMARSVPCFAFVVYRYKEDAVEASREADGLDICGRRIRVTTARPRTRGRSRRGFDPSMRCYQCGERGHFSRDCPDTKYGYKRPPSRERNVAWYGCYMVDVGPCWCPMGLIDGFAQWGWLSSAQWGGKI